MNFKNGNKNNWRRWAWNQVARRISRKREAIVLYLAGPDDLDRAIALEKGFSANNLIAVEKDKSTLARLRAAGVLTIDGTLEQTMLDWSVDRPVSAVIGDFYCGLELQLVSKLFAAMHFPAFLGAVSVFNFLRGRDPSSNDLRSAVNEGATNSESKNRAHAYWLAVTQEAVARLSEADPQMPPWALDTFLCQVMINAAPEFNTYKSPSGQCFDSIAMSPLLGNMIVRKGVTDALHGFDPGRGSAQRRRISAILAHRTMRA